MLNFGADAYISIFTKSEKRHAIIGIRQRDADSGLGLSETFELAGALDPQQNSPGPPE